ncbi:MAG: hypothetical protein V1745_02290 [Patescibacteria group bacterium]
MPRAKRSVSAKPGLPSEMRRTHPMRAIWSGVAVVLLLVFSVPMFVDAVEGQQVDASSSTQTTALIAALGMLGEQVQALRSEISSLGSSLSGTDTSETGTSLQEGMPECLQACRMTLASCLSSDTAAARAPLRITTRISATPLIARLVPLDSCRSVANTCISQCRPRTVSAVECQDRCAVALGGCVDAAGTDTTKLADCRRSNQQCLIAACLQISPDQAALDRIPSTKCTDQCGRALRICRSGAAFDQAALDACDASANRCLTILCNAPASRPVSSTDTETPSTDGATPATGAEGTVAAPTTAAPGQAITVKCENACTASFLACRERNSSTPELLATCDKSYGNCREACLKAIGGGYLTPTVIQPLPNLVVPTTTTLTPILPRLLPGL